MDVGRNRSLEELEAAVEKGPHSSALEPMQLSRSRLRREKVKQGLAKIYTGEWLKNYTNTPSLNSRHYLAMIPHKSRKYRVILDLSYQLLVAGYLLPSVNGVKKECALEEATPQIGSVLSHIIEALGGGGQARVPSA